MIILQECLLFILRNSHSLGIAIYGMKDRIDINFLLPKFIFSQAKQKEKLSPWVANHPLSHHNKMQKGWCDYPMRVFFCALGHYRKFGQNMIQLKLRNLSIHVLSPNELLGMVIPLEFFVFLVICIPIPEE